MSPFHPYKQYWHKHYCTRGFFHLLNYFLGKHLGQRFCACLCDDTHICQPAFCKFCDWITQLPTVWVAQLDHAFLATKNDHLQMFLLTGSGGSELCPPASFSASWGVDVSLTGSLALCPIHDFSVRILFAQYIF